MSDAGTDAPRTVVLDEADQPPEWHAARKARRDAAKLKRGHPKWCICNTCHQGRRR